VIEEISDANHELAQKIMDKMFVFEDLAAMDERGMQTLLREVSTDQLLLALRGVGENLKKKYSVICPGAPRKCCEMTWKPRLLPN